ncbi:dimethylsulfonioproprionate lyase family protein [Mesorhizobium sp. M0830]|uniref:dimethylsulfonioproprionate lyase family protein n=1 Tax=Mesorhizobium sp. M0830 TaxID=2957008 RepID=UPI003337070A
MVRSDALQYFVDTAFVAFDRFSHDLRSRRSIIQLFAQAEVPGPERTTAGSRLPVCSYLGPALAEETVPSTLRNLVERFKSAHSMLRIHSVKKSGALRLELICAYDRSPIMRAPRPPVTKRSSASRSDCHSPAVGRVGVSIDPPNRGDTPAQCRR